MSKYEDELLNSENNPDTCINSDGDYDSNVDRESYIVQMKIGGFFVIFPEPNELFIDIDTDDDYALYADQYKILIRDIGVVDNRESISRNGLPGRHVTITLPFEVSDVERIAWQAALGSDPKRELLSMVRYQRGVKHPTLFVEKP
jgi:hypothetical protein